MVRSLGTSTRAQVLNVCAQDGEWMAAAAVFDRMMLAEVQPNEISCSTGALYGADGTTEGSDLNRSIN